MTVKIVSNSGSGSIVEDSILSYSFSEEVTAVNPAKSNGGVSQLTLSAMEEEAVINGETLPNSKLLINNTIQLHDSDAGFVSLQVKKVSTSGGVVTITGDTLQGRLNVEKVAEPFFDQGIFPFDGTLAGAITYYCSLCGITPIIDANMSEAETLQVNFMGWKGNVWDKLKELCSGVSLSNTDNINMEMYISDDELHFRKAGIAVLDIDERALDLSQSVDTFDAAQSVSVYNYNTFHAEDRVVYDISNYDIDVDPNKAFKGSIGDSLQVAAGETIKKRFTIDADLTSVNQPTCVEFITSIPYSGTTGEYAIYGYDNTNLPVMPAQWIGLGGSLTVELTENPNEIEITVTAPDNPTMTASDGTTIVTGPYHVGVETSGDGVEYPALFITGTGVFYNKQLHTFYTGADDAITSRDSAQQIDNMFITSTAQVTNRGIMAAQEACGPTVQISANVENGLPFGSAAGSMITKNGNKFRVNSVSHSVASSGLSADAMVKVSEFNSLWSGLTFADFDSTTSRAIDQLAFNEFTVVPLIKE